MYKATIVKFKKPSGWSKGPMKPTLTEAEGTANQVKTAIDNILADIGELSGPESITVAVKFVEDPE